MPRHPLQKVVEHMRSLAAAQEARGQPDGILIGAYCTRGDEVAFATLVRRHGPLVFGVCNRVLHHQQDTEDAFQAVFIVLAKKAGTITKRESVAGWLHRVAYGIALDARKAARRRQRYEGEAKIMEPANPAWQAAWREVQGLLDEEIQRLPDKYREPFVLCCLENLGCAEAARRLGIKEGTVWTRLAEARSRLQARLTRRGVTLSAVLGAAALVPGQAGAGVPAGLTALAVRAATASKAGALSTGIVSKQVAALVRGATASLLVAKAKVGVTLLLAMSALASAAGWSISQDRPVSVPQTKKEVNPPPENKKLRLDALGDPLPDGALARLGTSRFQEDGEIWSLEFSPDGKLLASRGALKSGVRIWHVMTGKEHGHFVQEKSNQLFSAAFTPDGKMLLTSGAEKEAHVWDIAAGKEARRIPLPTERGGWVVPSPDGKTMAVLSGDQLELLDLASGKSIGQEKQAVFGALPPTYAVFNPGSGASGPIVFSPDGKNLAFRSKEGVRFHNVVTGKSVLQIRNHEPDNKCPYLGYLAFSPDGMTLATDAADSPTIFWNVATGEERFRIKGQGRFGYSPAIAFSPDSKLIASVSWFDSPICLWDTATGKQVRSWPCQDRFTQALAFSPDGKTLATGGSSRIIHLRDVVTGQERLSFARPPDVGSEVHFLADSKSLLTSGSESSWTGCSDWGVNPVRTWDATTGKVLRHIDCQKGTKESYLAFSADGEVVAVGSSDDNSIRLRQVSTWKELWKYPGVLKINYQLAIYYTALSGDGKKLALSSWDDRFIHLWDTASGKQVQKFEGHNEGKSRLAFSPAGDVMASAILMGRGQDWTLRVWDIATGKERWNWSSCRDGITDFVFSPDGKLLATVGNGPGPNKDGQGPGEVRLFNVATGKEVRRFDAQNSWPCSVAFAPDGRILAIGAGNCIHLWDVATGQERRVIRGDDSRGWCLSFSPDGRRLASHNGDGTVVIWDLAGSNER